MAVKHGGNLLAMAGKYGSDPAEWIDLSTGVSPFTYPVGDIPLAAWNQLPQENDGLEQAAANYYNASVEPVVVAGSQAAIKALPEVMTEKLGRTGTVALPSVGYKEHQHAWGNYRKDGCCWQIEFYDGLPSKEQVATCDVVLVINPNNPTGKLSRKEELTDLYVDLAKRKATLIIDEAFIDCTPNESMLSPNKDMGNLVVLRSVGKFFGLAGARVGFVFAEQAIKDSLSNLIGPWTVTGPSRSVVKQALSDSAWQSSARVLIHNNSIRLSRLIAERLTARTSGTDLFITAFLYDATFCYDFLCREKVLTRLCDEKNALRFGLPADEKQWQHLAVALEKLAEIRNMSANKELVHVK
ncbi:aminotransferase class I/II-fold pyridoxal phosphate-dependent enzyme [Photobacterium sp. SDRW27]|uniref:threonine-phosphate decarboxylase n=1 Tax=Photobacterium obscurum TaxID=2829490 RepID=UPI0022444B4A|nr:threonine-phosphate decarboxylase [Photobacterium obscurum]MCW8329132.1 aminotransferase class I/II-fold pyridoxal phosphate-dependent enzyme [Photobacterium obscurum]